MHVKQVVSLTVNQHGPLPFTKKIGQLIKQDGGETLGDVELIYPFPIITGGLYRVQIFPKKHDSVSIIRVNSPCQRLWHRNVCGVFVNQVVFLTVNHRGPLPLRELHSTDDTIDTVWRDPGGSLVFSRPVSDYEWIPPSRGCRRHRHTCIAIFVKQVVFLTVNHRGPLPLRELHSTDDTIVWRDPGGSWACLRPVSNYEWIHPSRGRWWHKHNYMYLPSFWSGSFFLRWITADPSPWGNFTPPTTQ